MDSDEEWEEEEPGESLSHSEGVSTARNTCGFPPEDLDGPGEDSLSVSLTPGFPAAFRKPLYRAVPTYF